MAGSTSSPAPAGAANTATSPPTAPEIAPAADVPAGAVPHGAQADAARVYTPEPSSRRAAPAPVEALSAYEEELLRAYSRTLAGTYERWKEDGEDMPLVLAVMLRQWRSAGCPAERSPEAGAVDGGMASALHARTEAHSTAHNLSDCQYDSYDDSRTIEEDAAVSATAGAIAGATTGATAVAADATAAPTAPNIGPNIGPNTGQSTSRATTKSAPKSAAQSPLLRESSPRPKADKSAKNTESSAQMTLPGVSVPRTPGETAPMSNYLARTSLFAPIRKGRRVMHDKQMLHSPEGIDVLYTGKQLDMADQDVYLTALRLAGGIKAGDRILINRAAFLRMLGYKHNPGARDYKWLEESFYRISTGRVIIKAKHIEANLPLMGALLTDTRSGDYYFTIPRETYALWAKNLYSYIDLEKRHALERNVPLSKWLQSYAQSHAPGTHTISMDLLHLWCGYGGRLRDFRDSLTGALEELTRVGILTSWSIQERGKGRQKKIMISWIRERTHRDDAPPPLVEGDN